LIEYEKNWGGGRISWKNIKKRIYSEEVTLNIGPNDVKYVLLSAISKFKGISNHKKIIIKKLKYDKIAENKQLEVATYLIDRLALRVGNEKDEADTVGRCTLRVEYIKFEDNNYTIFDFHAKVSMRYLNMVKIEKIVYDNLKKFTKEKDETNRFPTFPSWLPSFELIGFPKT